MGLPGKQTVSAFLAFVSGSSSVKTLSWVSGHVITERIMTCQSGSKLPTVLAAEGNPVGLWLSPHQPFMLGEFEEVGFEASEV